jgi:hypothetical protein
MLSSSMLSSLSLSSSILLFSSMIFSADDNDGTGPHKLQNASNVALPPRSRLAFD